MMWRSRNLKVVLSQCQSNLDRYILISLFHRLLDPLPLVNTPEGMCPRREKFECRTIHSIVGIVCVPNLLQVCRLLSFQRAGGNFCDLTALCAPFLDSSAKARTRIYQLCWDGLTPR
jgi:hypothetical protein